MLRNVALTAPYGHNGAYPTLEGIIRHHVDEAPAWTRDMANLPDAPWLEGVDFAAQDNRIERQMHARFRDTTPIALSDSDVAALVDSLNALTGTTLDRPPFGAPAAVPSGLQLD
jgi:cytochrome c peroxidase